jgi:colicin import membrane protein
MQQQYQKHVLFSILLHIILLTVLVVSFEFSAPMPVVNNADKVIDAMIIDVPPSSKKIIQKPLPEPPQQVRGKLPKELPKEPVKPIQVAPPKKPDAIAIPDKKQKKLEEDLIQKELLADMQKQHEKQQKKIKQKSLQAEFEKEIKDLKAKTLKNQMVQEQKHVATARTSQMKGVVDKYKALILQTISQHWLVPSGVDKKRSAELLIRVAPSGVVLDVQLTKSSGDDALDRSARAAVLKSSPLPVPTDLDAFEAFRQFVLKVKPENLLASDSWMG